MRAFVAHLLERYGTEEVRSWYFEVWNEPDLHMYGMDFWRGSFEDYLQLYACSARVLKELDPALRKAVASGRSTYESEPKMQENWRPQGDSNPCYRRERAVSWASRRWGLKADALVRCSARRVKQAPHPR